MNMNLLCATYILKSFICVSDGRISTEESFVPPIQEILDRIPADYLQSWLGVFQGYSQPSDEWRDKFSNTLMVTIFLIIHNHAATLYLVIRLKQFDKTTAVYVEEEIPH
jgi:hypothetical protein